MNPRHRLLSLALAVSCGLGSQVYGQAQKLPPAIFKGEVVGVRGDTLQVKANEQGYLVKVGPMTKVYVEGPVEASALRKGVFVNFTVPLDSRGNAQQELGEISIFKPSDVARPAVQKEGEEENRYYVAGQIQSLTKSGKLTVVVGRTKVTGQIAKDAKIAVAIHDAAAIRLARAGSMIEVDGQLARQASDNATGLVLGRDLRITLPALPEKTEEGAEPAAEGTKPAAEGAKPEETKDE